MQAPPNLGLRPEAADGADEAFLFHLFAAARWAEMSLMPLDAAGRDSLLRMQFRSMNQTYRQQFPNARFEIAELAGTPIGRLVTDLQPDCVYYVDIAIDPSVQRGGVATALMRLALDEARRLGLPGRVKVIASNQASLALCRRLGFTLRSEAPPFVDLEWRPSA